MKQRLFTIASAVVALVAAVLWVMDGLPRQDEVPASNPVNLPAVEMTPEATPPATPMLRPNKGVRLYSYSIPTAELLGLAPDAAPGTRLDLWVAVQPPIYKKAEVLPLIEGAVLAEVIPPQLPDGPFSAILQVPLRHVRELMWADRFGSISVLEIPSQP